MCKCGEGYDGCQQQDGQSVSIMITAGTASSSIAITMFMIYYLYEHSRASLRRPRRLFISSTWRFGTMGHGILCLIIEVLGGRVSSFDIL